MVTDQYGSAIAAARQAGRAASIAGKRAAFEQAVQAGAKWGYEMACLGATETPVPLVEWDPAGLPRIVGGA